MDIAVKKKSGSSESLGEVSSPSNSILFLGKVVIVPSNVNVKYNRYSFTEDYINLFPNSLSAR